MAQRVRTYQFMPKDSKCCFVSIKMNRTWIPPQSDGYNLVADEIILLTYRRGGRKVAQGKTQEAVGRYLLMQGRP